MLPNGGVLAVVPGLGRWEIPASAFPGGMLSVTGNDAVIAFRLPADLPVTLTFRFELGLSRQWLVTSLWSGWPGGDLRSSSLPFGRLAGPQSAPGWTFDIPLSGRRLASLCGAVAGLALAPPAAARLRLDQRFTLSLDAVRGSFAALSGQVAFKRLAVTPAAPDVPGWRAGAADGLAETDIDLGHCEATRLVLRVPAKTSLAMTGAVQPVRLDGDLSLSLTGGGQREGPIRVCTAQLDKAGALLQCKLEFPDKPWRMQTRHGSCDVRGVPDGAGMVRACGGKVWDADLPLLLSHIAVSAADADVTRLDFGDASCFVTLPGTAQEKAGPGLRLTLGANRPLTLSLDDATLYLARARDLLNLRMRFNGVDLLLDSGGGAIAPRLAGRQGQAGRPISAAPRPAPADSPSTLVAEFPPQHILAQAYLRQTLALPDLDPPITAADRRVLARGGEAAQVLRGAIAEAKLKEPNPDLDQVAAFTAFANAWKVLPADQVDPSEKPWIGPAGLISVAARQAARALARSLRSKGVGDLAARLGTPASDGERRKRVEDAVTLLAFPEPFLDRAGIIVLQDRFPDPDTLAAELLKAAATDDRDSTELLRRWDLYRRDKPALPQGLLLMGWPSALTDVKTKNGANLTRVTDADVEPFLKTLADERKDQLASADWPEHYVPPPTVRLAGRSRLAFHLECSLPFTLAGLTAWHRLRLRVSQRAHRIYVPPEASPACGGPDVDPFEKLKITSDPVDILQDRHIPDKTSSTPERIKAIASQVTAPGLFETAIELPARLHLSPAQDATWLTPVEPGPALRRWVRQDAPALMWTAELVERNAHLTLEDPLRSTVRAIWSPDFGLAKDDATGAVTGFAPPEWGPWDPIDQTKKLRFPLDRLDRHDLVFLSSVDGLPATAMRGSVGDQRSSQVRMPTAWEWSGLASDVDDPALYVPRPLRVRRLALTARGGWLDHDTTFRAPASPRLLDGPPLYPNSSLLRVRNLVAHGHDVVTTSVRSGYLYPLGIQASLVRETTLQILATNPTLRRPGYATQEVQRVFIEVSQPEESYPAQGQPYLAREAPFSHVRMVTTHSPDLIDPSEDRVRPVGGFKDKLVTTARGTVRGNIAGSADAPAVPLSGEVFWPRTDLGAAGTVQFQMHVNHAPDVVNMKLLFVDANAANSPETLRALRERYYHPNILRSDRLAPVEANRVQHRGAPRVYAPEAQTGDTTFRTNWQDIIAAGREEYADPDRFDAAQQGAGQPPFYPKLLLAEVIPQQIEALTGRAAEPVGVKFHGDYVRNGFDSQKTGLEAEWFLDAPNGYRLDMGSNGDRGGGLGRQDHAIIGFSRKGPVGRSIPTPGKQGGLDPVRYAQLAGMASDAGTPHAEDLDTFADQFFGEDAKLLGIIKYRDLIKLITAGERERALPVLQETLGFGLDGLAGQDIADGGVAAARMFESSLRDVVAAIRAKAEAAVGRATGGQVDGKTAFPQLFSALDGLQTALGLDVKPTTVLDVLASIWSAGQRLVAALNEIARSPLGPVAGEVQKRLLSFSESLGTELQKAQPGPVLRDAALAWLTEVALQSPWRDLVLLVPPALRPAVDKAITPDVWTAANPLAEVVRRVAVPELTEAVLRGPLYDELEPVIAKAARVVRAGLQDGAAPMAELLEEFARESQRVRDLAAKVDTVCADAAGAAAATLRQLAPAIGTCGVTLTLFALPGRDACTAMDKLRAAAATLVNDLRDAVRNASMPVIVAASPVIEAAEAWRDAIAEFRIGLGHALDDYDAQRSAAADALGGVTTCAGALTVDLGTVVQRLEAARTALLDLVVPQQANDTQPIVPGDKLMAIPANLPPAIGQAIAKTETEFRAAAAALVQLPERISIASSTPSKIGRLRTSIGDLLPAEDVVRLDQVVETVQAAIAAAEARTQQLDAYANHAAEGLAAAAREAEQFGKDVRSAVEGGLREAERRLLGLVLPVVLAKGGPALAILDSADRTLRDIIAGLYSALKTARNDALREAAAFDPAARDILGPLPPESCGASTSSWSRAALLLPGECDETNDALTREPQGPPQDVLALWGAGTAAPQRIAKRLEAVAQSAMKSALLRLLDVDALRRQFEDELRKLVPLSKTVRNTVVIPFEQKTVEAVPGTPLANLTFLDSPEPRALTLASRITAQLGPVIQGTPPQIEAEFKGRLPPFDLEIAQIMTISFNDGITYTGGTGRSGTLTAAVTKVIFGKQLSFISALADSFTSGFGSGADGGNGPFCRVRLDRPAIEAGFRLNIATIPLGVIFSNINLLISALLPLDKESARFRLALSSLDSPFRCSVPPWGGTGFCGMEASAEKIELIEASFEFGGVADIQYGPLVGTAYVTTGVYFRKQGSATAFAALFSAGFAAQIACFGVSGSFVLRMLTDQGGGGISGTVRLRFSFSVGFATVSYTAEARRGMGNNFGGAGAQAADATPSGPRRVQLAALGDAPVLPAGDCVLSIDQVAEITLQSLTAADHWGRHAAYFDQSFRPA